jgi:hypothetical protein
MDGGWEHPYDAETMTENAVKPFFLLQNNWYKMMEYAQTDMASYLVSNTDFKIFKIALQYTPGKKEDKAALNFHLTQREKQSISASFNSKLNQEHLQQISTLLGVQ